jgi:hypothetical protein
MVEEEFGWAAKAPFQLALIAGQPPVAKFRKIDFRIVWVAAIKEVPRAAS